MSISRALSGGVEKSLSSSGRRLPPQYGNLLAWYKTTIADGSLIAYRPTGSSTPQVKGSLFSVAVPEAVSYTGLLTTDVITASGTAPTCAVDGTLSMTANFWDMSIHRAGVLWAYLPGINVGGAFELDASGLGHHLYLTTTTIVEALDGTGTNWCNEVGFSTRENYLPYSTINSEISWLGDKSGGASLPVTTLNAGTDPEGGYTAVRLVLNAGSLDGSFSRTRESVSVPVVTPRSSLWIKSFSGTPQTVGLRMGTATKVLNITSEWARYDATVATTADIFQLIVGNTFTPGVSLCDILVWGAQVESNKATPGDYIPTDGFAIVGRQPNIYRGPTDIIFPNSTYIGISDYARLMEKSATHLEFIRTITNSDGYHYANPGARVRFCTNSVSVDILLHYTKRVTRLDVINSIGVILVDGVVYSDFSNTGGVDSDTLVTVALAFPSSINRDIEVVWPICESLELVSVRIVNGSSFSGAQTARPSTRLVVAGDSMTQGMRCTDISTTWPFLLAEAKGHELINMGYGSALADAAHGTAIGLLGSDIATLLIGYNNHTAQTVLATFSASISGWVNNFRAGSPTAKLYLISPLFTTTADGAIPMQDYRDTVESVYTSLSGEDPNLFFIDGLSIMTNLANRTADGIHPNDLGASEIASNLGGIIS